MEKQKNCIGMKIISIILGALMAGFMWRCRGDGGWGSSWGLYGVGFVLMLLIYHFYGNRIGMKYEYIPLGSFLLGLGVTGYATVIEELAGVIWSDLPYSGEILGGGEPVFAPGDGSVYVSVNHWSGALIIFLMAFTLAPLFVFFVISRFSGKKYEIKHYVIACVIFFGVSLICKATIAHPILNAINPEQVKYASLGLKEAGFDYASPFKAYMAHFQQRKWTQDIPFFENYYMSIEHVSDFISVIAVSLYALTALKDKITCFVSLAVDFCIAVSSTVCSTLISDVFGHGFFENVTLPKWIMTISDWGVWEYLTGFSVGLFLMIAVAAIADRVKYTSGADTTPLFSEPKISFAFNLVCTVFILGIAPARVIGIRTSRLLENLNVLPDDEPLATILIIVLSIAFGILMIATFKKSILGRGDSAFDISPFRFASIALPAYLIMCFFAYFLLDDYYLIKMIMSVRGGTSVYSVLFERIPENYISETVMLITSALMVCIYTPVRAKLKKLNK